MPINVWEQAVKEIVTLYCTVKNVQTATGEIAWPPKRARILITSLRAL